MGLELAKLYSSIETIPKIILRVSEAVETIMDLLNELEKPRASTCCIIDLRDGD